MQISICFEELLTCSVKRRSVHIDSASVYAIIFSSDLPWTKNSHLSTSIVYIDNQILQIKVINSTFTYFVARAL